METEHWRYRDIDWHIEDNASFARAAAESPRIADRFDCGRAADPVDALYLDLGGEG